MVKDLLASAGGVSWIPWSVVIVVFVAQSCPTLQDPTDCGPPGSSVHGILQARVLERIATSLVWKDLKCRGGN